MHKPTSSTLAREGPALNTVDPPTATRYYLPVTADGAGDRFRPIGWWLKEADARLENAFTARLSQHGLTRRAWQVLASVARAPATRAGLVDQLSGFDSASQLHQLIDELRGHGWLSDDEDGERLRLTASGAELHTVAAAEISQVRSAVSVVLPAEDYRTLVGLLGRLVDAFPPATDAEEPDG